jgi:ammonium transporter, Amt family
MVNMLSQFDQTVASYHIAFSFSDPYSISTARIIESLAIGIFASTLINPTGPNGLLFGHPQQLLIQAIGVGVAGLMGFGGTFGIMKIIDILIGVRVSAETEEKGLEIEEHAESAYNDEGEFGKI